jgi:PRTRC genetic system protein C
MAETTTRVRRKFVFNGTEMADPDPSLSAEDVKKIYSGQYAQLTNASISGPETKDGKEVYTFKAAVGTKG